MSRLSDIRARCDAATPGPWDVSNEPKGSGFFGTIHGKAGISFSGTRADNEFIAYARTDIPYLLAEIERLQGELQDQEYQLSLGAMEQSRDEAIARAEKAERERDTIRDDFHDFATSGIQIKSLYCANRCDECTDGLGLCVERNCHRFFPAIVPREEADHE